MLPGLKRRFPGCRIVWVTAPEALDLIRTNPDVDDVETVELSRAEALDVLTERLGRHRWNWVISLDDEAVLCSLAARIPTERLSGAYMAGDGRRTYTPDMAPWFDMGLLSTYGKQRADELKILNSKSHPQMFAEMLGVLMGQPRLVLTEDSRAFAEAFAARHGISSSSTEVVGLNTGAGGRWPSKQLPVDRAIALSKAIARQRGRPLVFVLFGGRAEAERNRAIETGLSSAGMRCIDAGSDNALLPFAALIGLCDVLVASDSLALHIAVALGVRVVAFFAPTSAAEIELYGLGEKVASTAPDYCSYVADADTSTITVERLLPCVIRQLDAARKWRS